MGKMLFWVLYKMFYSAAKADAATLNSILLINPWLLARELCGVYVLPIRGRLMSCCSEGGEDDFSSVKPDVSQTPTVQKNTYKTYSKYIYIYIYKILESIQKDVCCQVHCKKFAHVAKY